MVAGTSFGKTRKWVMLGKTTWGKDIRGGAKSERERGYGLLNPELGFSREE